MSGQVPPGSPDDRTSDDAERPSPPRRRRRWPWAVGALVVVLVGAGIAVGAVLASGDAPPDDADYCSALGARVRASVHVVVFLDAGTDDVQVEEAADAVRGSDGVSDVEAWDQERSLAEARELFSDDQSMVDLLRAEDLPPSVRFRASDAAAARAAADAVDPALVRQVEDSGASEGTVVEIIGTIDEEELQEARGPVRPAALDDELGAELLATAPDEVSADVAVVHEVLVEGGRADDAVVAAAERVLLDAAERCDLLP